MIQFQIGKSYISSENIIYTVRNRSAAFITLEPHIPGAETIRKKIRVENDHERVNIDKNYRYILAIWPEKNEQQDNSQENDPIPQFEVGKSYGGFIIERRHDVNFHENFHESWIYIKYPFGSGNTFLHERRKVYSGTALNKHKANNSEYFYADSSQKHVIFASDLDAEDTAPTAQQEEQPAPVSQQEQVTHDEPLQDWRNAKRLSHDEAVKIIRSLPNDGSLAFDISHVLEKCLKDDIYNIAKTITGKHFYIGSSKQKVFHIGEVLRPICNTLRNEAFSAMTLDKKFREIIRAITKTERRDLLCLCNKDERSKIAAHLNISSDSPYDILDELETRDTFRKIDEIIAS